MPYKDPEQRKEANARRMRERRAAGEAWIDPEKERERKQRWYAEGGREKVQGRVERLRETEKLQNVTIWRAQGLI